MEHKETGRLSGTEFYFKQSEVLKRAGFRNNQYLHVKTYPLKGQTGFTFTKARTSTTLQVSDDPKRLFIAVDLKRISKDVKDGQNYEVKVNSGKIVLQLLPNFDGDKIKSTISEGIEKTDFKTKKGDWIKQKNFEENTWELYLLSIFEGLYTSAQLKCGMAGIYGDLKTRVSEAGRGRSPHIGVYIIHDDVVDIDKLTSDILVDEKLNKLYEDGLIFFGKTSHSEPFSLIGMSCHRDATVFKILREIYPGAKFVRNDFSIDADSYFVLAAAYLFPSTKEFDPSDSLEIISEKVSVFAQILEEKMGD